LSGKQGGKKGLNSTGTGILGRKQFTTTRKSGKYQVSPKNDRDVVPEIRTLQHVSMSVEKFAYRLLHVRGGIPLCSGYKESWAVGVNDSKSLILPPTPTYEPRLSYSLVS
jgi:hypothetical protein